MSAIALTPKGKDAAEVTFGHGPKYAVLYFLYEQSTPREVEEIVEHLHTDPLKVQSLLKSMINEELIEELGGI